jgi:ProP effector
MPSNTSPDITPADDASNDPAVEASSDTPVPEPVAEQEPASQPTACDAASAPEPAPAAPMSPEACAQQLKQSFPALFRGAAKPLKLRVQADIQERAPGIYTKAALSAFLRRHTGSTSYLIAMTNATQRFDLDGAPAGEVTPEHRQAALDELARRRGNREAREEQEQQEYRNRAQLLRDFETTKLTEANFCVLKGVAPEELQGLLAIAREERTQAPPARPASGPRPHDRRDGPPGAPRDARGPRDGQPRPPGRRGPPRTPQG